MVSSSTVGRVPWRVKSRRPSTAVILLAIDLSESVIAQARTACAAETNAGALSFRRQAACKGLQSANRPLANEIRGRPRPDRRERLKKKAGCTAAARQLAKHKVIRG